MKFDDFTFGNDKAGVNLARILKESNDKHLSRSVSRFVQKFDVLILMGHSFKNEHRRIYYHLLKGELKARSDNSKFKDSKAMSHAFTHIKTNLKKYLHRS